MVQFLFEVIGCLESLSREMTPTHELHEHVRASGQQFNVVVYVAELTDHSSALVFSIMHNDDVWAVEAAAMVRRVHRTHARAHSPIHTFTQTAQKHKKWSKSRIRQVHEIDFAI